MNYLVLPGWQCWCHWPKLWFPIFSIAPLNRRAFVWFSKGFVEARHFVWPTHRFSSLEYQLEQLHRPWNVSTVINLFNVTLWQKQRIRVFRNEFLCMGLGCKVDINDRNLSRNVPVFFWGRVFWGQILDLHSDRFGQVVGGLPPGWLGSLAAPRIGPWPVLPWRRSLMATTGGILVDHVWDRRDFGFKVTFDPRHFFELVVKKVDFLLVTHGSGIRVDSSLMTDQVYAHYRLIIDVIYVPFN